MRKRMTHQRTETPSVANQHFLDVEHLAQVEVSSEDAAHPIESALMGSAGPGWRAAEPGQQTVRLLFDEPQKVKHIHLGFQEDEHQRTQEFVLRWSADGGQSYREIVRQQYNFSPPTTTSESEDYDVQLDRVTVLELQIIPAIDGSPVAASLAELRLLR